MADSDCKSWLLTLTPLGPGIPGIPGCPVIPCKQTINAQINYFFQCTIRCVLKLLPFYQEHLECPLDQQRHQHPKDNWNLLLDVH